MDHKNNLYTDISALLEGINSQVDLLKERQGDHEIETDILLSDIRNLYSLVKRIDSSTLIVPPTISKKEEVKIAPIQKTEEIPSRPEELVEMPEEKIKVTSTLDFPEISPIKNIEIKNPTSIAERYQGETSLHERIGKNKDEKSIAQHLKKPISDLKTGIGLNEKFLFINKLYKGKAEVFEKDINHINALSGAEEAKNYLKSNSWSTFEWNESDEVLENFLNLIERRFLN